MSGPSPFWDKARHQDRQGFLQQRAAILRAVREWFWAQGFTEAEPNIVAPSPGAETHIDAFEVEGRYLHTSPEFAMKKLLAAGEQRLFYLGKCWRKGETGPLHAPEFTMIEWYRAGASWKQVAEDCLAIISVATKAAGAELLRYEDRTCKPHDSAIWRRVEDAWGEIFAARSALHWTMDDNGEPNRDAMATFISEQLGLGFTISDNDTWSDIFSRVLSHWIEPSFHEFTRPLVLHDYPAPEAALARRRPDNPRFAERFEVYACGVELANGFQELTDPVEQRRRLIEAMDEKEKRYGKRWPLDEDFLAALAHMPPASGVAMGFDRLVMLATGARHINDVLWTPT